MRTKHPIQASAEALLSELRAAGAIVAGREKITCPFHDDAHPSGGIYEGDDGVWRYKCQAGSCGFHGDYFDVRAKHTGQDLKAVIKAETKPSAPIAIKTAEKTWPSLDGIESWLKTRSEVKGVFKYTNPETLKPDLVVFRIEPSLDGKRKGFIQCSPRPGGVWAMTKPSGLFPIYNRLRVAEVQAVLVVEGEKCVHALADLGIVATTSPGGAGKAQYADWAPLSGKTVTLWPDFDDAGRMHMDDVAKRLESLDPPVKVQRLDPASMNLSEKGDAADFIANLLARGVTRENCRRAIEEQIADAAPTGAADEVKCLLEDMISGKWYMVPFPKWPRLGTSTKSLIPGTVTVLCGDPGDAKSFLLIEAMIQWHGKGVKVAVYELEEDRRYHLHRALAILAGNSDLTDDEWVKAHPDEARDLWGEHADFLDGFGRCVYDAPKEITSLKTLTKWVEERAKAGCRVIAVDPVTAASTGDSRFNEDLNFVIDCKTICREHGASLILVTHPKKGRKRSMGLDDLAGGAAYARFTQTVLWIERHQPPKKVKVTRWSSFAGEYATDSVEINRTIHISKTRNGRGAGTSIGFNFGLDNAPCFVEQGVIVKEK